MARGGSGGGGGEDEVEAEQRTLAPARHEHEVTADTRGRCSAFSRSYGSIAAYASAAAPAGDERGMEVGGRDVECVKPRLHERVKRPEQAPGGGVVHVEGTAYADEEERRVLALDESQGAYRAVEAHRLQRRRGCHRAHVPRTAF
jgi:hypothetical protein